MAKPKKYEKTLYIRITKELKDRIEIEANKENVDPTDLVRKILETNKKLRVKDKRKGPKKINPISYKPGNTEPFRLSSSRIELYQHCKKCFYLQMREGILRPSRFPLPYINLTVDNLLKSEMDYFRGKQQPHPIFKENNLNLIPYNQEELINAWRGDMINIAGRRGLLYKEPKTNFILTAFVDDIMLNRDSKNLTVVDFRISISDAKPKSPYHKVYDRRIEFQQWLLRKNNLSVDNTGYFLYCIVDRNKKDFQNKIEFSTTLMEYEGNDFWIEPVLHDIKSILENDRLPESSPKCEYCLYSNNLANVI